VKDDYSSLTYILIQVIIHPLTPSRGKERGRRYRGHPYYPDGDFHPLHPLSSKRLDHLKKELT
jgi:hypothetical protein